MVHRVAHFDARGEGVDRETTGFLLKPSDQRARGAKVLGVAVEGGGELAFERAGAGEEFGGSFPAHDERERPKRFRR